MWTTPHRLLIPVFTVEATALALVSIQIPDLVLEPTDLRTAALLVGLGLAHTEVGAGVERARRRLTGDAPHVSLSSVWTFAAAVLLPAPLAALVAAVIVTHLWWRSWRPRAPLYRHLFTTATIVLSCLAATAVEAAVTAGSPPGWSTDSNQLVGLVLAMLVYTTINSGLVAGAIAMNTAQPDLTRVLGRWDDNLLEIATLSLGALVAASITINPGLVAFLPIPLVVMHRAVLVKHLEVAANTDSKTGLLNAAAWHVQADRALRRTRRTDGPRGVLVLDLDHFKAVNDTHGHLAGDVVLAAVADSICAEVRERDLVGRFGGEEFVIFLAGLGTAATVELHAVADRICHRIAALRVEIPTPDGPLTIAGLSISIGAALQPEVGSNLRTLLQIADTALYSAKRAGRNTVRIGCALA